MSSPHGLTALLIDNYDRDFDRLAGVLAFDSRWLAPAGTLD